MRQIFTDTPAHESKMKRGTCLKPDELCANFLLAPGSSDVTTTAELGCCEEVLLFVFVV